VSGTGSLPYVRGSDTSKAAADAKGNARNDEERVLALLRHRGDEGATDDEIEVALGLIHQNASARRRGLVLQGFIKDSGKRRETRTGRDAVVWIVTNEGIAGTPVARRDPTKKSLKAVADLMASLVAHAKPGAFPEDWHVVQRWLERKSK
jgi:hypothetical protein